MSQAMGIAQAAVLWLGALGRSLTVAVLIGMASAGAFGATIYVDDNTCPGAGSGTVGDRSVLFDSGGDRRGGLGGG